MRSFKKNINNPEKIKTCFYILIVIVFTGILLFSLSYSYAFFTFMKEKEGALNLISGSFSCQLDDQVFVIPPNTTQTVTLNIEAQNSIDSKYQLYYKANAETIVVTYLTNGDTPNGDISATGARTINVNLQNKSDVSQEVVFGVQCGLQGKDIILAQDEYPVQNAYIETMVYEYTGDYQSFVAPVSGYYQISLYGASGSDYNDTYSGGRGAYTEGMLYLNQNEIIYIYVGESKPAQSFDAAYNGGGAGNYAADMNGMQYGYSGGGATDVRYFGEIDVNDNILKWNSEVGLNSRIMVAAGGGGAGFSTGNNTYTYGYGGDGGTYIGKNGSGTFTDNNERYVGTGATNTVPGSNSMASMNQGKFGEGGYNYYIDTISLGGAGGGGGYYGGGASIRGHGGGGGGSSFISGYAGVNAIDAVREHTNQPLHYSGKYFVNAQMVPGVHEGNGLGKISDVGTELVKINSTLQAVRYIKDCTNGNTKNGDDHWVELQAIKNGVNLAYQKSVTGTSTITRGELIVDGVVDRSNDYAYIQSGSQCITVDLGQTYDLDEIAVWHYYYDGRTYRNHSLAVSSNNTDWTFLFINSGTAESVSGYHFNAYTQDYSYTGKEAVFVSTEAGYYQLEVWGAQGGKSKREGGYGGYATGILYLPKNESLFIHVGGEGGYGLTTAAGIGGYNGGGNGGTSNDYTGGAGGGGATHISFQSGILSSLVNSKEQIIIVAGGGGGASLSQAGSGGGMSGSAGNRNLASPGTQTSGYAFGRGGTGRNQAGINGNGEGTGGGGGGYYGGYAVTSTGASTSYGGSGGSGYIGYPLLLSIFNLEKAMYCFNCDSSDQVHTKTYSNSPTSSLPFANTSKLNSGYARIRFIAL